MKDSRSGSYLDIALTLSRIGKIDTLHELTKAVLDPELSISIICGILDYYSGLDARAIVVKLINDAIVVLKNIGNYLLRSWRTCFLLLIAHRIGDNVLVESLIDDIKIYDNWINEKEPEENNHLRDYFFRVLIAIGRQEQAMEYIKKWESYSRDSDDEFFKFHNLNVRIQVIVEKELNAIEYKIRLDRLYSNHGAENADTKYFLIVLQMAEMIPGNTYKEESLNAIAKRMAKLGFYEDALKIKTMIEHENFNNEIDFAVCLSAVTNGHVTEAMKYASVIHDENTKYSIQLCMAPGLSQLNFRQEAESFVKQWGSFIFSIS